MAKRVVGTTIKPPKGWRFRERYLVLEVSGNFTPELFDAAYAWAKRHGYGLVPSNDYTFYLPNGVTVCATYEVYTESWDKTVAVFGDGTWSVKDTKYSIGQTEAVRGGRSYFNQCANCMRGGVATWIIGAAGRSQRFCSNCSEPCSSRSCPERIRTGRTHIDPSIVGKCLECAPRERCRFCATWFPLDSVERIVGPIGENHTCKPCEEIRRCSECSKVSLQNLLSLSGKQVCNECYGKRVESERKQHERFGKEELPKHGSMLMESLSNRPIRTISVETEVDGNAGTIASTLYNCGIVRAAHVESYGTHCPDETPIPAFLKYDGSVTGGELINFLMQMDKSDHAESFLNVLSKMRSLEKLGSVKYNPNCGGHIHIDAHNFSTDNIWRLVTGYNYLEEVIFRLAGAGCNYGHRTLVAGHDAANQGRGYSHPTTKGPWGIKSNVHRALSMQDRMTGLNFVPYFRAVQHCACGCGAERLRSCKCTLPKCTIEWRVWNSTGNPRILHGWFAFMQSLHAWADSPREMTADEEKALPPFAWTKVPFKSNSVTHKGTTYQRVRWIFENLVFTTDERDSLAYAFSQTDIEFPDGFWEEVARIPTPKNRVVKAPRNCFIRRKGIITKPPSEKAYNSSATPQRRRGAPQRWNDLRPGPIGRFN